jgi:hypothetical protein
MFGVMVVERRDDVARLAALPPAGRSTERARALDERRPRTLAEVDLATISEAARNLRAAEGEADREAARAPELSDAEQQQVQELQARDREVRAHEQAHRDAAGDLAVGGATYTYETGPDGERYAIGGSVDIRLKQSADPAETARDMERAQRAANAPTSPSGPDRAVAARAAQLAAAARRELLGPGRAVDVLA